MAPLVVALAACIGESPAPVTELPPPPSEVAKVDWYHLTQGSGMVSYNIFRSVERAGSTEPFAEGLDRYGLIADPSHAQGLPIGLAIDQHENLPFQTIGQTCAACHEAEITYQGKSVRIDGGPGLFESTRFFDDFVVAFQQTLADKDKLHRFVARMANPSLGFGADAKTFADAHPLEALFVDEIATLAADEVAALERQVGEDGRTLVGAYLNDANTVDPTVYHERLEGHALLGTPSAPGGFLADHADTALRRTALANEIARLMTEIRLTLYMVKYTEAYLGAKSVPSTRPGPGRIDAFGLVRAQIVTQVYGPSVARPLTGPASIPHLWNIQTLPWLHWSSNMNAVMGRNVLEAVGSGAVVDFGGHDTWAEVENLAALEKTTRDFRPPVWPAFFPPIDTALAAKGQVIFAGDGTKDWSRGGCADCHASSPPPGSTDVIDVPLFTVEEIGVDPTHAHNWAEPVEGRSFAAVAAELLPKLEDTYAKEHAISEDVRRSWERGRAPDQITYRVADKPLAGRPLTGIWATAPYLHNGSVPTLHHLLLAPDQRPKTFPLGHREYDPALVGYRTDAADAPFVFDVAAPVTDPSGATYDVPNGNGNGGHAYGVALSEPERAALLEYLKTL